MSDLDWKYLDSRILESLNTANGGDSSWFSLQQIRAFHTIP